MYLNQKKTSANLNAGSGLTVKQKSLFLWNDDRRTACLYAGVLIWNIKSRQGIKTSDRMAPSTSNGNAGEWKGIIMPQDHDES